MKKNISYYVLGLLFPFFIFTNEGHAFSFFDYESDSSDSPDFGSYSVDDINKAIIDYGETTTIDMLSNNINVIPDTGFSDISDTINSVSKTINEGSSLIDSGFNIIDEGFDITNGVSNITNEVSGITSGVSNITSGVSNITNGESNTTSGTSTSLTKTRSITTPVFSGPGLIGGANIIEAKLDNHISKERNLKILIIGWTKFLYPLAALAAVLGFVWAGILYITAMGDDGKIESAKKIMIWTIIGLIAILSSYAVVNTVMKAAF